MAEQMTELQLMMQERMNTGTTWTRNEIFEKNGYLVIKNLWNPEELYHPLPLERGQMKWWGKKINQFVHQEVEMQVKGSLSRYWYPQYRQIHSGIRIKLEKKLGKKLYNTYYYDRYYFSGQELTKHTDRPACEISVSIHVGTNLEGDAAHWPIWIKTPDTYTDKNKTQILISGENHSVILKPGDGMIYKGCERPHWRDPMPTQYEKTWYGKKIIKKEIYYHQIFFHYVLQDGYRAQYAWDRDPE